MVSYSVRRSRTISGETQIRLTFLSYHLLLSTKIKISASIWGIIASVKKYVIIFCGNNIVSTTLHQLSSAVIMFSGKCQFPRCTLLFPGIMSISVSRVTYDCCLTHIARVIWLSLRNPESQFRPQAQSPRIRYSYTYFQSLPVICLEAVLCVETAPTTYSK